MRTPLELPVSCLHPDQRNFFSPGFLSVQMMIILQEIFTDVRLTPGGLLMVSE